MIARIAAAAPLLVAAAVYFLGLADHATLEAGLDFELMYLHATIFLGSAIAARPSGRREHVLRWSTILGLVALYTLWASGYGGWRGVAAFWAYGGVIYLGAFVSGCERRLSGVMARWVFGVAAFLFAATVCALTTGTKEPYVDGAATTGAVFFLALAVVELTGAPERMLRDRGAPRTSPSVPT